MKLIAQLWIWASLLIITMMSGGAHYIHCACKHKIYTQSEDVCCRKESPCMTKYDIPVPDGIASAGMAIDNVQQPLVLACFEETVSPLAAGIQSRCFPSLSMERPPASPPPVRLPLRL